MEGWVIGYSGAEETFSVGREASSYPGAWRGVGRITCLDALERNLWGRVLVQVEAAQITPLGMNLSSMNLCSYILKIYSTSIGIDFECSAIQTEWFEMDLITFFNYGWTKAIQ